MPVLNKLYGGDGTEYDIGGGGANVLENIAKGNNLLNPDNVLHANYYYNFTDGKTKVPFSTVCITDAFTYIPEAEKIYIICKAVASGAYCAIYCYHDDEYLGYEGFTMATTATAVTLKANTNYIRLYCNKSSVATDNFCVSLTALNAFENYVGVDKLERQYVPMMAEGDSLYPQTLKAVKFNPLYGKNVLLFGDSIPAYAAAPEDTATLIANITGANVRNCAVGGATMGDRNGVDTYNAWSMWRLAYAIVNDDWTFQEAHLNAHAYCADIMAFLKATDFTKVDSILIMYGYNDSNIDNQQNPLDTSTMGGALRYSIETLLAAYPHIKIYPCSLTYNGGVESSTTTVDKCETIKSICSEYHLKYIDNFNIGINDLNKSFYFNGTDYTHININGRKLVAQNVAKEML